MMKLKMQNSKLQLIFINKYQKERQYKQIYNYIKALKYLQHETSTFINIFHFNYFL